MDKDRERFARLAERAKQPPFTPLENLLVRGKAELWAGDRIRPEYWIECSCGCDADEYVNGGYDQRVIEALAKLRERKGIVVEEKVVTQVPPVRSALNDYTHSITYASQNSIVWGGYL